MPRPLRIEFENACYHVMNRGAGQRKIYKTSFHRNKFIELLGESNKLFGIEIHAYCLMDNHYHLLVKTPHANLSRAMRHINGIYTQIFNKTEKVDGPLFRGRYKAIIISHDEYFLNVSRYIHLNPVEAKIVEHPKCYRWSSYQYFIDPLPKPDWLIIQDTFSLLGSLSPINSYSQFINEGIDIDTADFFNQEHRPSIFGNSAFKNNLLKSISDEKRQFSINDYNRTRIQPPVESIIQLCIQLFEIDEKILFSSQRGKLNLPRKLAIYACRMLGGISTPKIAKIFGCKNHSYISKAVLEIDNEINQNGNLRNLINRLKLDLLSDRLTLDP